MWEISLVHSHTTDTEVVYLGENVGQTAKSQLTIVQPLLQLISTLARNRNKSDSLGITPIVYMTNKQLKEGCPICPQFTNPDKK